MSRIVILSLVMVCFTGCQLVSSGATPVTLGQMEKTPQPGDWCGVTFPEMRKGQVTSRKLWTGQVEKVDDDTITLVEVVEQARDIGSPPIVGRVPYINRLFKNTGVGITELGTKTLTRTEFERLDIVSQEEAESYRQKYEQVGVDFDSR